MACIVPTLASGQISPNPSFHSNKQVSEIFVKLLAYGSVAHACKHNRQYYELKTALVQALELANKKGGLTSEGKVLYRDPETYLTRGAAEYENRPYVTCGQASGYYSTILDYSKEFIRANS
jgi:hypothetical protein